MRDLSGRMRTALITGMNSHDGLYLAAFYSARNYRGNHKLFVAAGIWYNPELPRQGFQFVTRKISTTVANIHLWCVDHLELGDIECLEKN